MIGTLSVILRYIKINALHLDVSFTLREARTRLNPSVEHIEPARTKEEVAAVEKLRADAEKQRAEKVARAEKELKKLFKDCGYALDASVPIDKIVDKLLIVFESQHVRFDVPRAGQRNPQQHADEKRRAIILPNELKR